MDLQGKESMVVSLRNGQKWSNWNFSSSLQIYFSILPLSRLELPLRKKHSFSFWHWENERMLLTICVVKNFKFSSGSLSSLTCDLGSLSLLSNRADSLVTSLPSEVRKCAESPEHLRSEISFLRTCNIPNLILYSPGAKPGGAFGAFPRENFKTLHSNFDICRNFQRIKMKFYILITF